VELTLQRSEIPDDYPMPDASAVASPEIPSIVDVYSGHLMPDEQVHTFRHTDRAFATRTVRCGGAARPLGAGVASGLPDFPIIANGTSYDLYDYVSRNRLAGLLVMQGDVLVHEQYELGIDAATRWLSMSMAKSVSTTLVGAAIADRHIGSVEDLLTDYLPNLRGSGYDGVSIRALMQMTSGVRWDDTHTNPVSERRQMLDLQVAQQPGAIMDMMAGLPRENLPGSLWNYSTGETHVVGALLKAATGKWLADYLSERIWSRIGMEADAEWWLEAPGGLEVAGSGLCATLRDYARFGRFILDGGVIDGEPVVPPGWTVEAGASREIAGTRLDYGYMWWAVPARDGSLADGAFSARGIFGQYIYINPARRLLIVVLSARSKPKGAEAILDNDFFNSVVEAIG
jgi:CubicO group peptidase (beta-lactamase class C family)